MHFSGLCFANSIAFLRRGLYSIVLPGSYPHDADKIIFASTGTIYGLNKKKIVSEKIIPSPITVYDENKLLVEKIAGRTYFKELDPPILV